MRRRLQVELRRQPQQRCRRERDGELARRHSRRDLRGVDVRREHEVSGERDDRIARPAGRGDHLDGTVGRRKHTVRGVVQAHGQLMHDYSPSSASTAA